MALALIISDCCRYAILPAQHLNRVEEEILAIAIVCEIDGST